MSAMRIAPYVAAALLKYARNYGQQNVFRGDFRNLSELATEAVEFEVDQLTAQAALAILVNCRLATVDDDEFAGRFFKVDYGALPLIADRASRQEIEIDDKLQDDGVFTEEYLRNESRYREFFDFRDNPVIRKYHEFGDNWLAVALDKINRTPFEAGQDIPSDGVLARVPDRLVILDQNEPGLSVVQTSLDDLTLAVEQSNDLSNAIGDGKSAAIAELRASKILLSADSVRVHTLVRLLGSTLRWLVEKAGGTVVSEAAKHLWKLIQGLFL